MYLYEYVLESTNILRKRCLRTDKNVFEMFLIAVCRENAEAEPVLEMPEIKDLIHCVIQDLINAHVDYQ